MVSSVLPQLLVGSHGWNHPSWQQTFYPGDLPSEWRPLYYANEFAAVLLPPGEWRDPGDDLDEWVEDLPESFQLWCELPDVLVAADQQALATLARRCPAFAGVMGLEAAQLDQVAYRAERLDAGSVLRLRNEGDLRALRADVEQLLRAPVAHGQRWLFVEPTATSADRIRAARQIANLLGA